MIHLIDKSALVAEINKRIMDAPIDCYGHQRVWAYNDVKDIIDTLEVKEVDLENDIDMLLKEENYEYQYIDFDKFAKHFFELGMSVSSKAQKEE